MKKIIYIFTFCFSFLWLKQSTAQKILNDSIKDIIIVDTKSQSTTNAEQHISGETKLWYQHNSLQQLLQLHSNVFVKNYGASNLSTISIRGSSAAQTSVLWNGININNAMTGITDFSLLPVSLFDNMHIQYGSQIDNTSLSGGIVLSNKTIPFTKNIQVKLAVGYESINMSNIAGSILTSSKHVSNIFKVNYLQGNAKYPFYNNNKEIQDTLSHALQKQLGLMNDVSFKFCNFQKLSLHTWIQHTDREIAPATFENLSAKKENINAFRNVLSWDIEHIRNVSVYTKIGYISEQYHYEDSLLFLTSDANLISIPFSTEIKIKPNYKHTGSIKVNANHAQISNQQNASLNKAGIVAYYKIDNIFKRFNIRALTQYEVSDVFNVPLAGSLTAEYKINSLLQLYGSISSTYRMPTLNELYYLPGGNVNLKPEIGKNSEAGFMLKKITRQFSLQFDQSFYNRQVSNWIVWYGNAILSPHNIQQVHSRGLETILHADVKLKKQHPINDEYEIRVIQTKNYKQEPTLSLNALYAYTLSTTEESTIPNDYSIGKQIPYVPRYQLKINPGYSNAHWDLQYIYTYTGYRFVTTDESMWLKPYNTSNIYFAYKLPTQKTGTVVANFKFNNIFNTQYEGIVGRVMPLRNYSLGITYSFR